MRQRAAIAGLLSVAALLGALALSPVSSFAADATVVASDTARADLLEGRNEKLRANAERLRVRADMPAIVELARLKLDGIPVVPGNPLYFQDTPGARLLLERALAKPGSHWAGAAVSYAKLLFSGEGGTKDPARARDLLQRAMADGSGEAAFLLAQANERGAGAPVDKAKAAELYLIALRFGVAKAAFGMARVTNTTAEQRAVYIALGERLLQADAANGSATSAFTLADYYASGDTVARDPEKARTWLLTAIARGHLSAPMRLVQLMTEPGSTLNDPAKILPILIAGAGNGSLEAALYLTVDHYTQHRFSLSDAEAQTLLHDAANAGSTRATVLAVLFDPASQRRL